MEIGSSAQQDNKQLGLVLLSFDFINNKFVSSRHKLKQKKPQTKPQNPQKNPQNPT